MRARDNGMCPRTGWKEGPCSHIDGIETADIVDDLWDEPECIYDNDGHPKRKEEPPPPEE